MKLTFLGTGTSHGIPMIACDCVVCTSTDPRDSRTRTSVLIEQDGKCILIDTAPELRMQCLANRVQRVDAVLYTHAHADHVVGLDDLRRFNEKRQAALPCYGNRQTLNHLSRMFEYAFKHNPGYISAIPRLDAIEVAGPFELFGQTITPIELAHGTTCVLGYRLGDLAYCTDCSDMAPASLDLLRGLDVLVLDALRITPHPTHLSLAQAIDWAHRIGAKQTFFTHIAHELLHAQIQPTLPAGMALAHDGLVVTL